jgi:hypothetical protein
LYPFAQRAGEDHVAQVSRLANSYPGEIDSRALGRALKNLGIQKRRRAQGVMVVFDAATKARVLALAKQYGITEGVE